MPQVHPLVGTGPKLTEFRSKALIALGGNATSRDGALTDTFVKAVETLSRRGVSIRAVSRFFNTPCFPTGAGPDYVNAAIAVGCDLAPEALLKLLHQTEALYGRKRRKRWGMRTLDLDLIAVGDIVSPGPETHAAWRDLPIEEQKLRAPDELILPHPRMHERAFVLIPLSDIAPDWRHPALGRSVTQMCDDLPEALRREVTPI